MGKRGVFLAIVLLFFIGLASAAHDATLELDPLEQYEATSQQYDLHVNNLGSEQVITKIIATIPGFEITGAVGYGGWLSDFEGDTITWHDGTIETNVIDALFQFLLDAPVVQADEAYTVTIMTEDEAGFTEEHTFTLSILNDATPPELSDMVPEDGSFVLEGTAKQPVRVKAVDPETGVKEVSFTWKKCDAQTASTLPLAAAKNNTYNDTINLTSYGNEEVICFSFQATNKGEEVAVYEGSFTLDGLPPQVSLVEPNDGDLANAQTDFSFLATDNLAPALQCKLLVDDQVEAEVIADNGELTKVAASELSEGTHTWHVTCTDMVGLEATSKKRVYVLDKTKPEIAATPASGSIIAAGTPIRFLITDNFIVDMVFLTMNNDTKNESENMTVETDAFEEGEHKLTVKATDQAGNIAEELFTYLVDKTPPTVIIFKNGTNGTNESDVHFAPKFIAEDNYDNLLACELFINDARKANGEATSGEVSSLEATLDPGEYVYRVECEDGAGNRGTSKTESIKILDLSGPDIEIQEIPDILRGQSTTIQATITDFSGVKQATGTVTDPAGNEFVVSFTKQGTVYTTTFPTNADSILGIYTVTVTATDIHDFSSTATATFTVYNNYLLLLHLDPATASPGQQVTASGTITKDDGSAVEEQTLTLTIPTNTGTTEISISITDGGYTHTFTAPGNDGDYDVQVLLETATGFRIETTETLTVATSSSGSSPGRGTRGRTGFSPTAGSGTGVSGSTSTSTTTSAPLVGSTGAASTGDTGPGTGTSDQGESGGLEGITGAATTEASGSDFSPVGRASSIFSLAALKRGSFWWTVLAMVTLITILLILGRRGHFHKEVEVEEEGLGSEDQQDWDAYLENLKRA